MGLGSCMPREAWMLPSSDLFSMSMCTSFPHFGVVKTSGDSIVTHVLFGDGPTVVSILSTPPPPLRPSMSTGRSSMKFGFYFCMHDSSP